MFFQRDNGPSTICTSYSRRHQTLWRNSMWVQKNAGPKRLKRTVPDQFFRSSMNRGREGPSFISGTGSTSLLPVGGGQEQMSPIFPRIFGASRTRSGHGRVGGGGGRGSVMLRTPSLEDKGVACTGLWLDSRLFHTDKAMERIYWWLQVKHLSQVSHLFLYMNTFVMFSETSPAPSTSQFLKTGQKHYFEEINGIPKMGV